MALAVYVKHLCFVVAVWSKDDWKWFFTHTKTWGQRGEANTEACGHKSWDQMRLANVWIIICFWNKESILWDTYVKDAMWSFNKDFFLSHFALVFLKAKLKKEENVLRGQWVGFSVGFCWFSCGPSNGIDLSGCSIFFLLYF